MCAGYNQSKRKEYIFRLKKLTEEFKTASNKNYCSLRKHIALSEFD